VVTTPIIPTLGKPKQVDWEFQARLGYIARPFLSKKKKKRERETRKEN
jgi:hypothetical protein